MDSCSNLPIKTAAPEAKAAVLMKFKKAEWISSAAAFK
jgi:hypothetical protein